MKKKLNLFQLDFEQYLLTIGEDNASEKVKIAHLVNTIGIPVEKNYAEYLNKATQEQKEELNNLIT